MAKSEKHINEAQSNVHKEPKAESRMGGARGRGSDVGNEKHADLHGTQLDGSRAEGFERPELRGGLGGAVEELHRQHPHKHNDHGPHHGTTTHIRHEPLHGMKPGR